MATKKKKSTKKEESGSVDADLEAMFPGSILTMAGGRPPPAEVLSTGSLGLDLALGTGGLTKGSIVELYGYESSGKTTLMLHMIAKAQKKGERCAFIDLENSFDKGYAWDLGVDTENLKLWRPKTGEEAIEICLRYGKSGEYGLIVLDSVAALTTKEEHDLDFGDNLRMGVQAKLVNSACRRLAEPIQRNKCLIVFINQLRAAIGYGQSGSRPTGGAALKFFAHVQLMVHKASKGEIFEPGLAKKSLGNRMKVTVDKSKIGNPHGVAEYDIFYGKGISREGEILDWSVDANFVKQSGSWFSAGTAKLGNGRPAAVKYLEDNPKLAQELEFSLFVLHVGGEN